VLSEVVTTEVSFKPLSEQEIADYCATNEPFDKAGSYGIQGYAGRFVTNLNGSYFAVMGLPLFETEQLLEEFSRR
jgi:septum formation protein